MAHPAKLVLRESADLKRLGYFDNTPDVHGITRWNFDQSGGTVTIEIAIQAGLPDVLFRAVLAHEYGHALLAGSKARSLPLQLTEGFCEALAGAYLESCPQDRAHRIALERMRRNPDSTYGGGYRAVSPALRQFGLARTLRAFKAGAVTSLGIPPPK
ncbi:protein DA1 [Nocardioides sediminis]|uniref:protein DA1 n=1 Tax=Nocardioides sediminis TaxID=433648 RepID=UPI00131EE02D|nr:protein DA1 [Nocardioides sediminis]